jgi:hypothetical protein
LPQHVYVIVSTESSGSKHGASSLAWADDISACAADSLDSAPECRICLESDNQEDMVSPCACQGTMQHAHLACLKHWCAEKKSLSCELCNAEYNAPVKDKLASIVAAAQERWAPLSDLAVPHGLSASCIDLA